MIVPKANISISKSVRTLSARSDKLRRSCGMGYVDDNSPDLVYISGKDKLNIFCSLLKDVFDFEFECSGIEPDSTEYRSLQTILRNSLPELGKYAV